MTLNLCLAGWWSRVALPSEKHGTQRSYSLHTSSAQRMRTVDVMSDEHTSQTYLVPPSVPRVPVFFLMTPMVPRY